MTKFYIPNTTNNKNNKNKLSYFSSILCSYMISHSLYFSYLIFFFPYIFKLFSFIYPLFFTTFLIFLSLVTTLIPLHSIISSKDGFFVTVFGVLIEKFHPIFDNGDDDDVEKELAVDGFEAYKVVFDVPMIELGSEENLVEDEKLEENNLVEKMCQLEEGVVLLKCESLTLSQEKESTIPSEVEEEKENNIPEVSVVHSNATDSLFSKADHEGEKTKKLGSLGSMRKEKEWRRTLACKLFEERHNWSNNAINVNGEYGEECMDLLWETPEMETNNMGKSKEVKSKKGRKKDNKVEGFMKNENGNVEVSENYEEYDDYYDNGKICCLQALKLSAGKMNLSMGRPNLVKVSKAFKGFGWLQSHVRRHGKKGCK